MHDKSWERQEYQNESKEFRIACGKCNVPLQPAKVTIYYLGHQIQHDLPQCPSCGQVYLSEETVDAKMKKLEELLEEK
jgi:ribosomal protein S27AE